MAFNTSSACRWEKSVERKSRSSAMVAKYLFIIPPSENYSPPSTP
jgi:hypothetical protein